MVEIDASPIDERCPCYNCSGPEYHYTDSGERFVFNNLHGELQPCENCGRAKTEHRDLGTKGFYECWWCEYRVDGS